MTAELVLASVTLAFAIFLLAFAFWVTLGRRHVYSFLFAALTMYGAVTLFSLPGLAVQFSDTEAAAGALVFSVGTACLLGSIFLIEHVFRRSAGSNQVDWAARLEHAGDAHVTCALITTPVAAVLMISSLSSLEMTWSEARAEGGGVMQVAATFLLLMSVPGALTAFLLGKKLRALVLFCGALVTFVFNGSRAAILGGLAYLAWMWLSRANSPMKRLRVLLVAGAGAFLVHIGLRIIRGVGAAALVAAYHSGNLSDLFLSSYGSGGGDVSGGEGSIPTNLVFAVREADAEKFGFLTSAVRILLLFIPKEFLGDAKPLDVTYVLWERGFRAGLFNDIEGYAALEESFKTGRFGSLHPTFFGELFVSGGWLSLIIGCVFFGAVCVFIDRALAKMNDLAALLLLGPVLVGMIFVARGNSVIGFGYFFYIAPAILTVQWFLRKILRRPRRRQAGGHVMSRLRRTS